MKVIARTLMAMSMSRTVQMTIAETTLESIPLVSTGVNGS
jgi:hypothetical protein